VQIEIIKSILKYSMDGKVLNGKIDTAVVLVGGPGTRLKPLTYNLPKAMISVCDKPLLEWIIGWLRENEVRQIILGVAYKKQKIIDYFGDGARFGVNIKYSVHSVEGGTGEGFHLAISRYIDKDMFFAMNGDQITDLKLNDLAAFHIRHSSLATVAITSPPCPYGHIRANEEHDVIEFIEKPACLDAPCSTGIYVFNRDILSRLPEKGDVEKTTFPTLAKSRLLKAYQFNGFFITVNTTKDLVEAEQELRRIHT
jgi:mannose-1-phosphate guanylyltransferase